VTAVRAAAEGGAASLFLEVSDLTRSLMVDWLSGTCQSRRKPQGLTNPAV